MKIKQIIRKYKNTICNKWFRNNVFKVDGGGNILKIEATSRLKNCSIICAGTNGEVIIDGNCSLSYMSIYLEGNYCSVHIREGVVVNALPLSRTCFNAIEGKHIEIGEYSLFSNGIELHTSDYHSIVSCGQNQERINAANDIIIGKHVWIGLQTIVLKGSYISDNTVIGACSLVSKRFNKSNVIIAGVPAKVIKEGIDWVKKKI